MNNLHTNKQIKYMCMLKQIQNNLFIQTTIVGTATLQQNVFSFQIDIPCISNLYNIVNIIKKRNNAFQVTNKHMLFNQYNNAI